MRFYFANKILDVYPELSNTISDGNLTHTLEALFKVSEIPIVFVIDGWNLYV